MLEKRMPDNPILIRSARLYVAEVQPFIVVISLNVIYIERLLTAFKNLQQTLVSWEIDLPL